MPQPTTQRRHPGWLTRLRRGLDWGAIFVLLSVLFLGMQLCADLIGVAAGATQFGQPWNVDLSGDNASGSGLGGGMIYTCAPGAPSRGRGVRRVPWRLDSRRPVCRDHREY